MESPWFPATGYRQYAIAAMDFLKTTNAGEAPNLVPTLIDRIARDMMFREQLFYKEAHEAEEIAHKKKVEEDELRQKAADEEREARERAAREEEASLTEQYGPLLLRILPYGNRVGLNKSVRTLQPEDRCKGLLWDMHNVKIRPREVTALFTRVHKRIKDHAPKIYTEFVAELKRMGREP